MVSKLSKEGAFRKGLEVYFALTDLNILPDTAITNAAISACDRGKFWSCCKASPIASSTCPVSVDSTCRFNCIFMAISSPLHPIEGLISKESQAASVLGM
jgi:hypothetical protein